MIRIKRIHYSDEYAVLKSRMREALEDYEQRIREEEISAKKEGKEPAIISVSHKDDIPFEEVKD